MLRVLGTLTALTVGDITGDVTGTADVGYCRQQQLLLQITPLSGQTKVMLLIGTAGGDVDGGNIGRESDRNINRQPKYWYSQLLQDLLVR